MSQIARHKSTSQFFVIPDQCRHITIETMWRAHDAGMVVANDVDLNRAFMLVHQCKRIGSPTLLIICQPAQQFPNMAKQVRTGSVRLVGWW